MASKPSRPKTSSRKPASSKPASSAPASGKPPARGGDALARMRAICLSLPDTKETLTWGEPHFRVGEKIFAGCGNEKGRTTIGFKLARPHAEAVIERPGFSRAPYVGHAGWVSLDASAVKDWDEVRAFVLESYRLIAPKRCQAKLDAAPAAPPRSKGAAAKRTPRSTSLRTRPSGSPRGSRPSSSR